MSAHPDDLVRGFDDVPGDDEMVVAPEAGMVPADDDEPEEQWQELQPLNEEQVKAAIEIELRDAIGFYDTELEHRQREGLDIYLGKEWNHQAGQSTVQTDDVRNRIEWAMPSLVRMYLGGHQTVIIEPSGDHDIQDAAEATEELNQRFREEMDGATLLMDGFKAAMTEASAQWVVRDEDKVEVRVKPMQGLMEEQLMALLAPNQSGVRAQPMGDPKMRMQVIQGEDGIPRQVPVYDVLMRFEKRTPRVLVEGVPNEEFLIGRRERKLDDETRFCGWRRRVTLSDLIDAGFDQEKVFGLPDDDQHGDHELELSRREDEQEWPHTDGGRPDEASREVWLYELWIRLDQDGDGHAELRHITCVGRSSPVILENEYASGVDFSDITPVRIPYKRVGLSFSDLLKQIERVHTTVVRQALDNFYRTNHAKRAVRDGGAVSLEDLLDPEPGGFVRVDGDPREHIMDLSVPSLGSLWGELRTWCESSLDDRGGSSKMTQGLDASALNESTASGMMAMFAAAGARLELMARVFEPGVRRLFEILLRKLISTPGQQRQRLVRGKWVTVDPGKWNPDWKVRIIVGLGQGRMQERIAHLNQLLGLQTAAKQQGTGLVDREELHYTATQLVGAMGFPSSAPFFKDPATTPPPPPPGPTPEQQIAEGELDAKRAQLELEAAKLREVTRDHDLEATMKQAELDAQMRMEAMRLDSQEKVAEMQISAQAQQSEAELAIKKLEIQKAKIDVKKAEVSAKAAAAKPSQPAARKKAARKKGTKRGK